MALPKRAKKFRQKHLSDKVEQKKREKKHAQLVQSRKSKKGNRAGSKPVGPPGPNFQVADRIIFDEEGPEAPGFAKYLSDSDKSDHEAEEQEYFNEDEEDEKSSEKLPKVVDTATIQKWKKAMNDDPRVLKFIVRAGSPDSIAKFANEAALDALRQVVLEDVPKMVSKFFPQPDSIKGLRPTFKDLADQLHQLLVDISGEDEDAMVDLITAVHQLLPYFAQFSREFKSLVKGLVAVVVRADRNDRVKLVAFNALREMSKNTESGKIQSLIAKQAYNSLIKSAAHTSNYTLEAINLAKTLFASLFYTSSAPDRPEIYQLAFQQIRQLALHLKTALDKTKHPDYDVKVVYTWLFVQSLDFWSRVISMSPGLHALIHPLCQVTLRVISLVPSPQYLPLRIYLVRSLIRVGRHTGVYIPLAPPLLEAVLHSNVLRKSGKPSSLQRPDFEAILHVPAGYLNSTVYQNAVLEEFIDVFVEAMVLYTKSIAFPDLVAPVTVVIRRFAKSLNGSGKKNNSKISKSLLALCERLEANARFIEQHRSQVRFGPRDTAAVDKFLEDVKWEDTPLGKEAVVRQKVREERRRLVAVAKQEDNTHKELEEFARSDEDGEVESEGENEQEINEALLELED